MSEIATDLVTNVAGSLFVADKLLTFVGGAGVNGIMEASTQQLGLGLILSTLLITVPPMAGLWFNGVMGNFTPFTPLSTWGVRGGQAMVPPNVDGGRSMQQVENRVAEARQNMVYSNDSNQVRNTSNSNLGWVNAVPQNKPSDQLKYQSQMERVTQQPVIENIQQGGNTDKTKTSKGNRV